MTMMLSKYACTLSMPAVKLSIKEELASKGGAINTNNFPLLPSIVISIIILYLHWGLAAQDQDVDGQEDLL